MARKMNGGGSKKGRPSGGRKVARFLAKRAPKSMRGGSRR